MLLIAMLQAHPAVPAWISVVAAFLVGCYVGSHVSVKTRFNVNVSQNGQNVWTSQSVVRKLELKCQCGAVHKFREGNAPIGSGLEPYPQGDSYTCSSCGRLIDLKPIRELATAP
jgi:hypothetical protein